MNMETVRERLTDALKKRLRNLSYDDRPRVLRASTPVEGIDLLDWLNGQTSATRIFWSRRDQPLRIAAVGAVQHLVTNAMIGLDSIRNILADADEEIRCFGGMRFDPAQLAEAIWQPFAKYHFVVPRFEWLQDADQQRLAINFKMTPGEDPVQLFESCVRDIERLNEVKPLVEDELRVVERSESPTLAQWQAMIAEALAAIRRQELEKIVLASRTSLTFNAPVNPLLLLKYILKKNGRTFHFAFQFQPENAFIGMSPECLFVRENGTIMTEAIASTRRRGATPEEDDRLATEMATSDKDLREHRLVKKMIVERLAPLCREVTETSSESLLRLTHVQHLLSEFRGKLKVNVFNEQILAALHPTPAVGGWPQKEAVERIAQLEPFDRGWYAAPVGWISRDQAEFAVAIRSAVILRERMHVYAGSGIVDGSDALVEWEENRNKARNFMQQFETE